MRRIAVLATAGSIAIAAVSPAKAVDVDLALLWHACPFLLDTVASAAMRRLDVPLETIGPIADYACDVARSYQQVASDPPAATGQRAPQTAEEIFCEGSSLAYCSGVAGAAPMSFAFRCWIAGRSLEQCAVDAIASRTQ